MAVGAAERQHREGAGFLKLGLALAVCLPGCGCAMSVSPAELSRSSERGKGRPWQPEKNEGPLSLSPIHRGNE